MQKDKIRPNKNRVALGTFPLANVFSKVTTSDAKKIVEEFLNNGGYFIHTAPLYSFGEVEKLLGRTLRKYPRERFYLSTMCGYIDVEGKTFATVKKSGKFKDVIKECERSLRRLGLDYIDLYFNHSPDPNTPFSETMDALSKLQDEGKIKNIGVSNVTLTELKEYNQTGKVKFVQNRFSLINRSIDRGFAKYLLDNKIGLVPYQPIERGQLTGKMLEKYTLKSEDLRIGRPDWEDEKVKVVADWVKKSLKPIADKIGITIGQLAIAWTLHQQYVSFSLVGTTNIKQMLVNLKADKVKLDREMLNQLEKVYKELENNIESSYETTIREFRGLNEKFY